MAFTPYGCRQVQFAGAWRAQEDQISLPPAAYAISLMAEQHRLERNIKVLYRLIERKAGHLKKRLGAAVRSPANFFTQQHV